MPALSTAPALDLQSAGSHGLQLPTSTRRERNVATIPFTHGYLLFAVCFLCLLGRDEKAQSKMGAIAEGKRTGDVVLESNGEGSGIPIAAAATALVADGLKLETAQISFARAQGGISSDG